MDLARPAQSISTQARSAHMIQRAGDASGAGQPSGRRTRRGGREREAEREDRLRSLRDALRAARQGDLSVRLPAGDGQDGVLEEVVLAFNALVETNAAF